MIHENLDLQSRAYFLTLDPIELVCLPKICCNFIYNRYFGVIHFFPRHMVTCHCILPHHIMSSRDRYDTIYKP